jgi:MoxR-like ATPase
MRQWVREVPLAEVVKDYAVRLVLGTHPREEGKNGGESLAQRFVLYGSSPRGLQSLILAAKARALLGGPAQCFVRRYSFHAAAELTSPPDSQSGSGR